MKNVARAFALVIALTGATAAARIATTDAQNDPQIIAAKATAFPIPVCPPDDPNACGMGGPNPNMAPSTPNSAQ